MSFSDAIYWIKERESIRIRKEQNQLMPWTRDPILRSYRFCNVRREDDTVTRWIADNVRDRFAGHENLWLALCLCRIVNWPPTLKYLMLNRDDKVAWPCFDGFDPKWLEAALYQRTARGEKAFTGAYIIPTGEKGESKAHFVAHTMIGALWSRRSRARFRLAFSDPVPRLAIVHQMLQEYQGWGPFLSYQAVVDMRFTELLSEAADVQTWAAAGPGTIRGLNRVAGRSIDFPLGQNQACNEIVALWSRLVNDSEVEMDLSDVPNVMCEVDKYLRVKNGEGKPRARYVPGRGA